MPQSAIKLLIHPIARPAAVPNILVERGANLKYCERSARKKNLIGHAHKSLATPTKTLLERVFDEISRYRVRFLLNAEVCVLTVVTADSRTFEDHQITSSVVTVIICHYGLTCWGGGAVAPCPALIATPLHYHSYKN